MFNPFKSSAKSEAPQQKKETMMIDQTMIPGGEVFDENKVDFKLNGGPKYTDVLVASAVFNEGDNKGIACPLICKWFYTFKNNELQVIDGITGSFYQPTLDDIGARIWVHAYPINGIDEYQGMPMFAEVGPLIMDDEVLNLAQGWIIKAEQNSLGWMEAAASIKKSNIEYLKQK